MIHEVFPVGSLECNCSIVADESTREAFVVDPGDDLHLVFERLEKHALRVKTIIITHAHIDHIGQAAVFKRETGAPMLLHPREHSAYDNIAMQAAWLGVPTPERAEIDAPIQGGDVLTLGETEFRVLDTPGHSPGSVSLYIPSEKTVIAADALFYRSIGRTDLPGGNHAQLLKSIRTQLFTLPDDTYVVTGHGRATSIGDEKRYNPFFRD